MCGAARTLVALCATGHQIQCNSNAPQPNTTYFVTSCNVYAAGARRWQVGHHQDAVMGGRGACSPPRRLRVMPCTQAQALASSRETNQHDKGAQTIMIGASCTHWNTALVASEEAVVRCRGRAALPPAWPRGRGRGARARRVPDKGARRWDKGARALPGARCGIAQSDRYFLCMLHTVYIVECCT